jgi:hypothetical protein
MKVWLILLLLTSAAYAQEHAQETPPEALTPNVYDREAMGRALQLYHQGKGPLPDLIAVQEGLNQVIAPPLAQDDLQTLREAIWKREANNIQFQFGHEWPVNKVFEAAIFQQMAWTHLLNGGALRAGDFTALHGALLSALQPNTYAMAKKWQGYMKCVGIAAKKDPTCVGY